MSKKETILETQLISSSSSSSPVISASSSLSSASLPPSDDTNLDDLIKEKEIDELSDEYEERVLPTNLANDDYRKISKLNHDFNNKTQQQIKSDATSVRVAVR